MLTEILEKKTNPLPVCVYGWIHDDDDNNNKVYRRIDDWLFVSIWWNYSIYQQQQHTQSLDIG